MRFQSPTPENIRQIRWQEELELLEREVVAKARAWAKPGDPWAASRVSDELTAAVDALESHLAKQEK